MDYKFSLTPEECPHKIYMAFFDITDYSDLQRIKYDIKSYCCGCGAERPPTMFEADELKGLFNNGIVEYRFDNGPIYSTTRQDYAAISNIELGFNTDHLDKYQLMLTKCAQHRLCKEE